MEWFNLSLALLLPLLLGATCVNLTIAPTTPGRPLAVWGNGMMLGLFLTPLLLRLQDSVGIPLEFTVTSAVLFALLLIANAVGARHFRWARLRFFASSWQPSLTPAGNVLFGFFTLLIALRVFSLGLELWWRPLFPWDATMHWASKARVWFDAGGIVPFVENQRWLQMRGDGVFTDHHPGYPATIPLLQVWVNSALGRWDESLMNLPWWQCIVGLGAAFFGQARAAGCKPLPALIFTYLLLSMPLLNIHVALAGYADLFLGAAYCLAIMAFHNWSITRDSGQGFLAIFFALTCPLIKNEGVFWLLSFLPALIVVLMPLRHALSVLACGFIVLMLVLFLGPQELSVAGHSLAGLKLQFRPAAAQGIVDVIWVHDNWHLLGYLLPGLLVLATLSAGPGTTRCRGVATAMLAAIVCFLVLFLFTRYAQRVESFTAVGRVSLQLAPALVFMCCLLWNSMSTNLTTGERADAAAFAGSR